MDFTVSLRYPLFYEALQRGTQVRHAAVLFFYRTDGSVQRLGASFLACRDQAVQPVCISGSTHRSTVGEKLGTADRKQDYYDVGYAHESNGQYVDSAELFASTAASVGGPEIAEDYISRGWDYLNYKRHLHFQAEGTNAMDIDLRYYLSYGLLQKGIEEYFPWEAPRPVTQISQVDGIRFKVTRDVDWSWFKGATLFYITGYREIARWNTFRAELGFTPLSDLMGVPIVVWGQTGYNVNVTQYYRIAWSVGVAASFETYQ